MSKVKIQSKIIQMLDELGLTYEIKNSMLKLDVWDSLMVTLNGKYAEGWKRWSNGEYGHNYRDLAKYFVKEGLITEEQAQPYIGKNASISGVSRSIKEAEPYDFEHLVTNPRPYIAKEYLTSIRKLSPVLVDCMFKRKNIVQDGRDNLIFLHYNKENQIIGGEVQGTTIDFEKFGKRGTLKYNLTGSKGLFFLQSSDVKNVDEINTIYFFEAPIDLLSFIDLNKKSPLKNTLYVSLSGAETKLAQSIDFLVSEYGFNINDANVKIATDNDESGNAVLTEFKESYPECKNVERVLPNFGEEVFIDGTMKPLKDWNDLLKIEQN